MSYVRSAALLLFLAACNDVENPDTDPDTDHDVITRIELSFAPGTGDALTFVWSDPELDGSPTIDPIVLPESTDAYTLTARFFNDLAEPVEEVTTEIDEDAVDHQLFYLGSGVQGPATGTNGSAIVEHAYADQDANGLPIGLVNDVTTLATGSGELTVVLRHLPPEGDSVVKVEGLAEDVASGGFASIGGDDDVNVTFPITVE